MDDQKKKEVAFDADFIMNQMQEGVRRDGMQPILDTEAFHATEVKPNVREKGRNKKMSDVLYESIFFKNAEGNARNGKSVYISPEFHERLTRIVQVIGEDKLTIYAYLNNVLDYHFQEFGDEIIKSFNDKYKPIL